MTLVVEAKKSIEIQQTCLHTGVAQGLELRTRHVNIRRRVHGSEIFVSQKLGSAVNASLKMETARGCRLDSRGFIKVLFLSSFCVSVYEVYIFINCT